MYNCRKDTKFQVDHGEKLFNLMQENLENCTISTQKLSCIRKTLHSLIQSYDAWSEKIIFLNHQ